MSEHCLVLHNSEPHVLCPSESDFAASLHEIGLFGDSLELNGDEYYSCGDRVSDFIKVSSYHLIRNLGTDGPPTLQSDNLLKFSIVRYDKLEFIGGDLTVAPHCSRCDWEVENWPNLMSLWWDDPERRGVPFVCPGCGAKEHVYELDWRRLGGFGQLMLQLDPVSVGEAEPTQELLDCLKDITGFAWIWMYLHL